MSEKISELTEATSFVANDLLPMVDVSAGISGTKRIQMSNFANSIQSMSNFLPGWKYLPITLTPAYKAYNGSSIVSVSQWQPSTAYIVGDYVRHPTSDDWDYMYICTKAGTSGVTNPFTFEAFTTVQEDPAGPWWESRGFHVFQCDTTPSTYGISVGSVLRPVYPSLVTAISSNYIALSCFYSYGNITGMFLGDNSKVTLLDFVFSGSYSSSGTENLLNKNKRSYVWRGAPSKIVQSSVMNFTNDTGGYNYINLKCDGVEAIWNNSLSGIQVGTSWNVSDGGALFILGGMLYTGTVLEIVKTPGSGVNNDAEDLNINVVISSI